MAYVLHAGMKYDLELSYALMEIFKKIKSEIDNRNSVIF